MIIDFRQIRAARALLDWSQADLARAADIATSSIKNIESANSSSRKETLAQIREAFETNGIEFTSGTGVRLRSDIVAVHTGKRATATLLDSIYETAHASPEREVLILGLDERYSVETDGADLIQHHIARLKAAGICEKILIREGDTHFLNVPEAYRWLPQEFFTRNAPLFIYGDKVAIHTGSLRRRAIIIELRPLAQHLRMLFSLLWDRVSVTPQVGTSAETARKPLRISG